MNDANMNHQDQNSDNVFNYYKKSNLCVGIDIFPEYIPAIFNKSREGILDFIKIVFDSTKDLASAYKFNLAFFEADGIAGLETLDKVLHLVPDKILKIGDAKRGDIGSTSGKYAKALFDYFDFDAITLNPYMGYDALEPFFKYKEKLNYVLCLTSNKSALDFQKLKLQSGIHLYEKVLSDIQKWNFIHNNIGMVFGATQEEDFSGLNEDLKDLHLLIPGIGAQGGDLKKLCSHLKKNSLNKFLINSSRGILYSEDNKNIEDGIYSRANSLNNEIQKYLNESEIN